MKKYAKILAVLLALVFVVSAFAACGKDKTKEPDDAQTPVGANVTADLVKTIDVSLTDEEYAFGVSKGDEELLVKANSYIAQIKADGTLEKIINNYFGDGEPVVISSAAEDSSKDQLVVATNAAFPPFESTEGENYIGIDMELAKGLADYLGKELVIKNIEFDAILPTVEAGQADIAIAGLTVNETRKQSVNFSDSYYTASQVLIVPADETAFDAAATGDDIVAILNGLTAADKIGVQKGTTGQFFVEGDEDWEFDGLPVECVPYSNGALAVQDMLNGNVKYVIIDQAPALFITDAVNGK
ncbi:MAG: transporter substrate-binding domain-containing protein [Clostridia bacterium]|nr:transporter substrate-binding domain-containing protein [Clostridia bacterium]